MLVVALDYVMVANHVFHGTAHVGAVHKPDMGFQTGLAPDVTGVDDERRIHFVGDIFHPLCPCPFAIVNA